MSCTTSSSAPRRALHIVSAPVCIAFAVALGSVAADAAIARAPIQAGIRNVMPRIRRCIVGQNGASGRLVVRFRIEPNGTVHQSDPASSTTGNAQLDRCIADAFKRARFPTMPGSITVNYPIVVQ